MSAFLIRNRRWLATGFLLSLASSFGQTWFISLFAGEIRAAHGLTDGGWGAIYTGATCASALLLVSRGALADTMPLSRLAPLIAGLFAVAAALMAASPSIGVLAVAVFLLRFCGQGMFTHIAVTAIGRWFHATRGRALSIAGLGQPVGEATLPLIFVGLIGWIGWRQTWALSAGIIALLVLPALVFLLAQDRAPQGDTTSTTARGMQGRHWRRGEVIRHWLFPALLPFLLTPGFIGTVMFFHQVHIAEVKGWSLAQMAPAYTVWATVSVVVALITGWACDRFGPHRLLPVALVPMGIAMLMIGPAQAVAAWAAILGVMAISQGIQSAMLGALLPHVYGTDHLGAIRSLQMALMVFSSAIGPGITGLLIDLGIDFPRQGLAMGLWCFALSAAMVPVVIRIRRELA